MIMAFQYKGEIGGGLAPVIGSLAGNGLQVGADLYDGQLLIEDLGDTGGEVLPIAVAAAGPDVTQRIVGICIGVITSPEYNATYKGNKCTYDVTNATLLANKPVGAAQVQVQTLTAKSLIQAPLYHGSYGVAIGRAACTTGSTGLTYVNPTTGHATVDHYSTSYCVEGANRGERRKITTGNATTQTHIIPFTNTIAVGDKFCWANIVMGAAHVDWCAQFQGIDAYAALTNYFKVYVHELNFDVAGQEYAVFTIADSHIA
jgi:hypothetical protein